MVFFHMPIIIFLPHPKKWLLLFGTKTGQQYAPAYSGRRDCRPESRLKSRSGSRSESKLKSRPGTDRGADRKDRKDRKRGRQPYGFRQP
ncbi:hypothetical protein Alfi_3285 [Alistipes finegoldii DSM 17242]|uniref:Uncharacterized protein n=1 Tax=Alistipes finegoldii (strain DSM 17242 / JCM 16770 / CCUG 46020 / CIP 107999 / KCTC 15236 / AHN 2437) TaxID=679935 RepID=I3YR95_ALIFI|nr:hypothetical protein Alfi_3285 [Alistipes finegoldii DSM 17242]